jgi:hypothetical protein
MPRGTADGSEMDVGGVILVGGCEVKFRGDENDDVRNWELTSGHTLPLVTYYISYQPKSRVFCGGLSLSDHQHRISAKSLVAWKPTCLGVHATCSRDFFLEDFWTS